MTTLAVMQPYFMPYLGYFRLLRDVDLFVSFDCVQFPRRGWVHRNQLHLANRSLAWLTLPVERSSREALIRDLVFDDRATFWLTDAARRFPALREPAAGDVLRDAGTPRPGGSVAAFLFAQLEGLRDRLSLRCELQRSSPLELPSELRGQERILEICRMVGAKRYLNAPGGRTLYDPVKFAEAGVELAFLPDWTGSYDSVLEGLILEGASVLSAELSARP